MCKHHGYISSALSSVSAVPLSSRPGYDPAVDTKQEDCVCVLSIGSVFGYVIPSFNVLQVEMRQARVKGFNAFTLA